MNKELRPSGPSKDDTPVTTEIDPNAVPSMAKFAKSTRELAKIAAKANVPLPWLAALLDTDLNMSMSEDLLWLCERNLPAPVVLNGRSATPEALANIATITIAAVAACNRSSERAKARQADQNELLLTDILNCAYLIEALGMPADSRLRLRIFAEHLRDRIRNVPYQADTTSTWLLRCTLVVAVLAKGDAIGGHGKLAKGRRALINQLKKGGFDLAACFPGADTLNAQCRRLEDWGRLFEKNQAGPNGLNGSPGEAAKQYQYLRELLDESDCEEMFADLCDKAIWHQKLGTIGRW